MTLIHTREEREGVVERKEQPDLGMSWALCPIPHRRRQEAEEPIANSRLRSREHATSSQKTAKPHTYTTPLHRRSEKVASSVSFAGAVPPARVLALIVVVTHDGLIFVRSLWDGMAVLLFALVIPTPCALAAT